MEHCQATGSLVIIKKIDSRPAPPQYYPCQRFFHESLYWQHLPRCAGVHLKRRWLAIVKQPLKCCNWAGAFQANCRSCPTHKKVTLTNSQVTKHASANRPRTTATGSPATRRPRLSVVPATPARVWKPSPK